MKLIKSELRDFFYFFGYADEPGAEETYTTFLKYSDAEGDVPHDKQCLEERFNGYLPHNEKIMKQVSSMGED